MDIIAGIRSKLTEPAPRRASERALASTEKALGFPLPTLLRTLYREIGNGGFGPDYGLIGVTGGHRSDHGRTLAELYDFQRASDPSAPGWSWPERVLPICDHGCAILWCLDLRDASEPVVLFDPSEVTPAGDRTVETSMIRTHPSLEAWLSAWLKGDDLSAPAYVQLPPRRMKNPFTGETIEVASRRLRRPGR